MWSLRIATEYQGPELSGERVDVNILSTLREPNSLGQTSEINKHFEVPASLATLSEGPADLHYQPVTDASD